MSGPAGRELQPSARGWLRASGRAATDFTNKHFHHDQQLQASRKQNRSRRDRRAAAFPRGGPLLLQAGVPRRPRPENELALARQFIFNFSFLIAPAGRSGPQLRPREGPLLASASTLARLLASRGPFPPCRKNIFPIRRFFSRFLCYLCDGERSPLRATRSEQKGIRCESGTVPAAVSSSFRIQHEKNRKSRAKTTGRKAGKEHETEQVRRPAFPEPTFFHKPRRRAKA